MQKQQQTLCVTGGTGYVAGHLIQQLLMAGHRVHATVRSLSKSPKLAALYELADRYPDQLELFQAELMTAGSFRAAMRGCTTVFHTASPFTMRVANPQRDLIEPAVKGTQNVLQCANQIESIQRVVLTSSVAAMYSDVVDCQSKPLDESCWNTGASLDHQPYTLSKTLAEQAAWTIAEAQSRWDLVVINPALVVGPAISDQTTSESFDIVKQFGDGRLKTGLPYFGIGLVDVRDVAQAHIKAAMTPSASGRYLCNALDTDLFEIAQALRTSHAQYPLPKRRLPKWLVWLVGPALDPVFTRKVISKNVGYAFASNTDKIRSQLQMEFRDVHPGIREMFQQLIDKGVFDQ